MGGIQVLSDALQLHRFHKIGVGRSFDRFVLLFSHKSMHLKWGKCHIRTPKVFKKFMCTKLTLFASITFTIQKEFLQQNFHYSKVVLMAKPSLFKSSSYGETSSIQM